MKKLKFLSLISLGVFLFACNKIDSLRNHDMDNGSSNTKASYTVRMTDAPGPYSAVNIDIQGVEITGTGGQNVLLNVNPGIYNILDYVNGLDTVIATGSLNPGTVQQIRLILGSNNSVVVDSVTYPLTIPSGSQSGLKIQVHQVVQAGVAYSVLLDFDANKSIVKQGNGAYKLKPVIRTINTAISGSIKGSIAPAGTLATVTASNGIDSFSSVVDSTGNFMIMGLPAGTYDVTITPALPFLPVTITGVVVVAGESKDIGLVNL